MATDHDELDPRLAAAIRGLEDRGPDVDLWPGIARRIAPRRPGTLQLRWPVAIAAALALVAGTAAITSALLPGRGAPAPRSAVATSTAGTPVLPARYGEAEQALSRAIDRLQEAYAAAEPRLDPATRGRIKSSLTALDTAIAEARRRADEAPTDLQAAKYLTRAMQRKLDVLQTVTTITTKS